MDIQLCENKDAWDAGMAASGHTKFLQSWDWGEFQRAAGQESIRLQVVEGDAVMDQAQGFVHRLPLGLKYLYVPRYEIRDKRYNELIFEYLKKKNFIFIRLEPNIQLSPISPARTTDIAQSGGYLLSSTKNRQPKDTLLVNLSQSEEELLAGMHPKTRYNIHLAEKKGVTVRERKDADIFWRMNRETTARDQFKSHGKEYYERMLALPSARQLIAYDGETPIASNILIVYGDTCTYLHGASSDTARNLMATYLLQWRGIQLGKSLGCRWYDLGGVAPPSQKSKIKNQKSIETCFHNFCWEAAHPWTGITRFKAGFGGVPRSYPQAVDIVFRPFFYRLYQFARKARGMNG